MLVEQLGNWARGLASSSSPSDASLTDTFNHICVQVSADTLGRFADRRLETTTPVNDVVLGFPLNGQARTVASTRVKLLPDQDRAVFQIVLTGTAKSTTQTHAGLVRIHARAVTQFTARKQIIVDGSAVRAGPAVCEASTRSTITRVTSQLPGLRGRLARRIGLKRAQARQAEADHVCSLNSQRTICHQFDAQVDPLLRQANTWMAILRKAPGLRQEFRFATTDHYLVIGSVYAGPVAQRASTPPPPAGNPSLVVQIPVAAVDSRLVLLAARQMIAADATQSLAGLMTHLLPRPAGDPNRPPRDFRLGLSPDGLWYSAEIDLRRGNWVASTDVSRDSTRR